MKIVRKAKKALHDSVSGIRAYAQESLVAPIVQNQLAKVRFGTIEGEDLMFVTGFDKSGTTWLRDLLDSHPALVCRGSGQFFNYFDPSIKYLSNPGGHKIIADSIMESSWWKAGGHVWIAREGIEGLVKVTVSECMRSFRKPSTVLVGDKSTVQDCGLIRSFFPKAKQVAIVRDGRDVAVSFAFGLRNRGSRDRIGADGRIEQQFLKEVAEGWRTYAQHLRDHGNAVYVLYYEKLLQDPVPAITGLLGYLGVTADPSVVSKMVSENAFEARSGGRKPGHEDPTAFVRKGIAGDWKNHFKKDDQNVFEGVAGNMLAAWGYAVGN